MSFSFSRLDFAQKNIICHNFKNFFNFKLTKVVQFIYIYIGQWQNFVALPIWDTYLRKFISQAARSNPLASE